MSRVVSDVSVMNRQPVMIQYSPVYSSREERPVRLLKMKRVESLQVRPVGYYGKRRNKNERSDT